MVLPMWAGAGIEDEHSAQATQHAHFVRVLCCNGKGRGLGCAAHVLHVCLGRTGAARVKRMVHVGGVQWAIMAAGVGAFYFLRCSLKKSADPALRFDNASRLVSGCGIARCGRGPWLSLRSS